MNAQAATQLKGPEPVTDKRALVIGGGIAGVQAALDLANARIRVTLVEKSASLGGSSYPTSKDRCTNPP